MKIDILRSLITDVKPEFSEWEVWNGVYKEGLWLYPERHLGSMPHNFF